MTFLSNMTAGNWAVAALVAVLLVAAVLDARQKYRSLTVKPGRFPKPDGTGASVADGVQAMLAKVGSLSFLPEQFIVVDLETTGLDPERCEIIEIGAIKVNRNNGTTEMFQTLVKPRGALPRKIVQITGITDAMLQAQGRNVVDSLKDFMTFADGVPLIAYNARFDAGFLRNGVAAHLGTAFRHEFACALAMARRAWPALSGYRLVDVVRHVDPKIDVTGAHRALDDCHLALVAYLAAARRLQAAI